jgi:hypothetical protein
MCPAQLLGLFLLVKPRKVKVGGGTNQVDDLILSETQFSTTCDIAKDGIVVLFFVVVTTAP